MTTEVEVKPVKPAPSAARQEEDEADPHMENEVGLTPLPLPSHLPNMQRPHGAIPPFYPSPSPPLPSLPSPALPRPPSPHPSRLSPSSLPLAGPTPLALRARCVGSLTPARILHVVPLEQDEPAHPLPLHPPDPLVSPRERSAARLSGRPAVEVGQSDRWRSGGREVGQMVRRQMAR